MPLYIVSYDLMRRKDYPELLGALEREGAQRVLYSQWALRHDATSAEIRAHFQQFIDADDRLLVTSVDEPNWASVNALIDLNEV